MPIEDLTSFATFLSGLAIGFFSNPPKGHCSFTRIFDEYLAQCLKWRLESFLHHTEGALHFPPPGEQLTSPFKIFLFLPRTRRDIIPVSLIPAHGPSLERRMTHRPWACFTLMKHTSCPYLQFPQICPIQTDIIQASSLIFNPVYPSSIRAHSIKRHVGLCPKTASRL